MGANAGLTAKQRIFWEEYQKDGQPSRAYRAAYNTENMNDNSIAVAAQKLLKNPKIALMIKKAQQIAEERHQVNVESLTEELNAALALAHSEGQASAAVSAIVSKAKLHGFVFDRKKTEHDVSDNLADLMREIDNSNTPFPINDD